MTGRPKMLIIVLFQNMGSEKPYYAKSPAPPLPGLLLAGLTPSKFRVEVLHEMARPVDYETDADYVALSFMDYCFPHAVEVARRFKRLGKKVIAGGRYASTNPEKLRGYFDCVVSGEAHAVWPEVCADILAGRMKEWYTAPECPPLAGIPAPRYDLAEGCFMVPVVVEATRGCNYRCSFCQLTVQNLPHRKRPVKDVVRDLRSVQRLPFYKRKLAMIYDNNLGCDMAYAKELLREIAKLGYWGIGAQFSFDCLYDDEFLDLLEAAHVTMAFIGIESMNEGSIEAMNKRHNKVGEYRAQFEKLKKRGILTFTGMIVGTDGDTPEYFAQLPEKLEEVDPSIILPSIAIPIPGTPFYKEVKKEGRLVDTDLSHYEGDHLVYKPRGVTAEQVYRAYYEINKKFFSWGAIFARWVRLMKAYLPGGSLLKKLSRAVLITGTFFELSFFELLHAEKKVFGGEAQGSGVPAAEFKGN